MIRLLCTQPHRKYQSTVHNSLLGTHPFVVAPKLPLSASPMIHQSKQRIKDPVFQLNKTMSGTPGSLGCPLEGLRSAEEAASDSATGTCQTAPTSSGCPGEAPPVTLPLLTIPPPQQQATGVPTRPTWTTATCLKAGLPSTQEKFRPGSPSRSRKQLRSKD